MLNLYAAIKDNSSFRKIEVSELLFAEYTCMREETRFGIWSDNNYFAFITSGKKIWRSIYNAYEVVKDDIIFIKKGQILPTSFLMMNFAPSLFLFLMILSNPFSGAIPHCLIQSRKIFQRRTLF